MTSTFMTAIEAEGASLLAGAEAAWTEAKNDLLSLEQTVLDDVKNAITSVIGSIESGATVEQIETMVLNLLQAEVVTLLKSLSSGALQVLIVFAKNAL